jgi:hypothetical protein
MRPVAFSVLLIMLLLLIKVAVRGLVIARDEWEGIDQDHDQEHDDEGRRWQRRLQIAARQSHH